MSSKLIIGVVTFLTYHSAYSKVVMPVLQGWYTDIKFDTQDTCFQNHYTYKNLETVTAFELAQKILSVQDRNDCYWERVILEEMPWYKPEDFSGSPKQWEQLTKNSSAITQKATRPCLDLNGNFITSVSTYIFPSYQCPKGSTYSLDTEDKVNIGCTTKPIGCFADVIGRNLNTKNKDGNDPDKIGIKNLGHIGLTEPSIYGTHVLEVLHEDEVIQDNPIDTFKNKAEFWGQRYGTQKKNKLELMDGINILISASEQRSCSPEYTLSWSFVPCNSGKPAKFRCDSFVYNAYLSGANIDLGYTVLLTYPSTIFNSMLNCRDELGSPCMQEIPVPEIEQSNSYILNPDVLAENKIKTILSSESININDLDNVSRTYVMSKDETRENKINLLWSLLIKHEPNPLKFDYLSDILSELEPIEKTDAIIKKFQSSNDQQTKLKYLSLLIGSMTIERTAKLPNYAYNAKIFLMNLLQTSQDAAILKTTIVNFPESFMDEGAYRIMSDRVEELRILNPEYFEKIVTNSNFWYQWLGLANRNGEFNSTVVESLFKQSNKYTYNKDHITPHNIDKNRLTSFYKKINKAFVFGLKSREKQNKSFHAPKSVRIGSLNTTDEPFLSDEMNYILKRFKKEAGKHNKGL